MIANTREGQGYVLSVAASLNFLLHREVGSGSALGTLCVESALVMIVMLLWLGLSDPILIIPSDLAVLSQLAGLGVLSLAGMLCYFAASQRLELNMFGLLGYLEPVLLLIVALTLLEETVAPQKLLAFSYFATAVVLVFYDGVTGIQSRRASIINLIIG